MDSFKTITESGEVVIMHMYQEFIITDNFGEEPQEIPGHKWLLTSNGRRVNMINESQYEILGAIEKIIVHRV